MFECICSGFNLPVFDQQSSWNSSDFKQLTSLVWMLEIPYPLISLNQAHEHLPFDLCNQVSLNYILDSFAIRAPVPPGPRVDTASEQTCDCATLLLIYLLELLLKLFRVSYLYYLRGTLRDSIFVLAEVKVQLCLAIKEEINVLLLHIEDGLVLPLGALVLIDQQGTDTLKEFGVVHEAICYLVLHLKRFFEVKVMATLDLLEDDGHAEGAEAGNLFADFRSELCLALLDSLIDVLNGICIEDPINLLDVRDRVIERVEVRVIHHNVKDLLLGGFISHSRF